MFMALQQQLSNLRPGYVVPLTATVNRRSPVRAQLIASIIAFVTAPAALGAQTDIYLFDIRNEYRFVAQVTDRGGYDSQPSFTTDSKAVLFTSDRAGGQTDIFPRSATSFATAPACSFGAATRIHSSSSRRAPQVGPENGETLFLLSQAGTSIHAIPGGDLFSFVQKQDDWSWIIKSFDPASGAIVPLAPISNANEYYCWTPAGVLLTIDGIAILNGDPKVDTQWKPLAKLLAPGFVKGGRCTVSADGRYLAVVNTRSP